MTSLRWQAVGAAFAVVTTVIAIFGDGIAQAMARGFVFATFGLNAFDRMRRNWSEGGK
jgi:hypothetical protein